MPGDLYICVLSSSCPFHCTYLPLVLLATLIVHCSGNIHDIHSPTFHSYDFKYTSRVYYAHIASVPASTGSAVYCTSMSISIVLSCKSVSLFSCYLPPAFPHHFLLVFLTISNSSIRNYDCARGAGRARTLCTIMWSLMDYVT